MQGSLERLKQVTQCGSSCDSNIYGRPHTISSAYERPSVLRPAITSQTFVDPGADCSRTSAVYATPNSVGNLPSRLHVADIQSRLSVIYAKRTLPNHPMTVPSVPPEYATCGGVSFTRSAGQDLTADDRASLQCSTKIKPMAPLFHRSCSLPPPVFSCFI